MNLSRRSLLFSLVVHGTLVVGGIFFTFHMRSDPEATLSGPSDTVVVSRPIQVKKPPEVISSGSQSAPPQNAAGNRAPTAAQQSDLKTDQPQNQQPTTLQNSKPHSHLATERRYPQATGYPVSRPEPRSTPSKKPARPTSSPPPTPEGPPGWGVGAKKPETGPTPGGENGTVPKVTRRAAPTFQPEFGVTKQFPELKSVSVKAEFVINEDGSYEPTLLTSSGNPTADVMILGKLLEFKWAPALDNGKPVKDKRVIDIDLDE